MLTVAISKNLNATASFLRGAAISVEVRIIPVIVRGTAYR
jgi:hypothetical protein